MKHGAQRHKPPQKPLIGEPRRLEHPLKPALKACEGIARLLRRFVLRLEQVRSPESAQAFARAGTRRFMANTTASASGTNRYRATPERKNIGKKTMQMQSVDTSAGTAICAAPSKIPSRSGAPSSRCRSMFSIVTVASSTRIPTASASPPSVMMLIVSCRKLSTITDVRIESGIDTANDDRAAPASEEQQDHDPGQRRRDDRLAHNTRDSSAHKHRLVRQRLNLQIRRKRLRNPRKNRPNPLDHVDRRSVACLEDRHQSRRGSHPAAPRSSAARTHRLRLPRSRTYTVVRTGRLQRNVIQLLDRLRIGIQINVVLKLPDLRRTSRQDQILLPNHIEHIRR